MSITYVHAISSYITKLENICYGAVVFFENLSISDIEAFENENVCDENANMPLAATTKETENPVY